MPFRKRSLLQYIVPPSGTELPNSLLKIPDVVPAKSLRFDDARPRPSPSPLNAPLRPKSPGKFFFEIRADREKSVSGRVGVRESSRQIKHAVAAVARCGSLSKPPRFPGE
jgi:hypothetical protein